MIFNYLILQREERDEDPSRGPQPGKKNHLVSLDQKGSKARTGLRSVALFVNDDKLRLCHKEMVSNIDQQTQIGQYKPIKVSKGGLI